MSPERIVDYLTYSNYRHNRNIAPHVTVTEWKKLYGPTTDAMEARYQADKFIEAVQAGNDHATAASGDAPASDGTNHEKGNA